MNVLRQLINTFRQTKARTNRNKRQRRFSDIITDKRLNTLAPIFTRLARYDASLTDQEILGAYFAFSDRIQTDTFAAAELEWATVATLCTHRPHLTSTLIRRGLLSIIWSIGDDITADHVLAFIQQRILATDAAPYGGWPPDAGLTWLEVGLAGQQPLVQQVLEDVIQQNRKDLAELDETQSTIKNG